MRIPLSASEPFDLDLTLCCGQAFRWERQDDWWYAVVGSRVMKARQTVDGLEFENAKRDFVIDYFGLDDDMSKILTTIKKDRHIGRAIDNCKGLRILRQDPWECLISYICATYKNIASIKRMLFALSRKFGEKISFEGRDYHSFPTPDRLAKASLEELVDCELGYRARYVSQTANKINETACELKDLRTMTYERAKNVLLDLHGVGPKVADCVLLFSLGKTEAFPVDIWVKRVMTEHYRRHFPREFGLKISQARSLSDSEYERLNLFGRQYFGKYAGYAQEYLYHYERAYSKPSMRRNQEIACGKRLNRL